MSRPDGYHSRVPDPLVRLLEPLVAIATGLLIVGVAVVPLLTPPWIAFAQDRAQATAWTGYTTAEVRSATEAILGDLVMGPPTFDVEVRGEAVLNDRERQHLRDVRGIFAGLAILVATSLVVLMVGRRRLGAGRFRAAARTGATGTVAAVVVAGLVASVAFDTAFEIFHRLFFAGGTYTFDPSTERLVQLFPNQFWIESTVAAGIVIAALGLVVRRTTGRSPEPA